MKFAVAILACLALAAPAASARPAEEFLGPSSTSSAEVAASGSAETRSTASGFDWGSAAIGAAGAIALLSVAAVPMVSRRRMRPAH